MRIIADTSAGALGLADPGSPCTDRTAASLPTIDRRLWGALSDAPVVSVAEGRDLGPPGFWWRLLVVDEAPASQFDVLRQLIVSDDEPLPGPIATLALSGRNFRGQRGRRWSAARGNMHLCVGLEPVGIPAQEVRSLTMLSAVAVVEGVHRATGLRLGIKWVNDLVLDGRKVGGVLTAAQSQLDGLTSAVLGIGLNVASAPSVEPTPFVPAVGCLREAMPRATHESVVERTLEALGLRYTELLRRGPGPLFEAYRAASIVLDREVRIWDESVGEVEGASWPPPLARGTVVGITPDLALRFADVPAPVTTGRLAFEEVCQAFGL
jgi:biotin-[acetyl-CoA-carboxylase] ligase BirA-like protein